MSNNRFTYPISHILLSTIIQHQLPRDDRSFEFEAHLGGFRGKVFVGSAYIVEDTSEVIGREIE